MPSRNYPHWIQANLSQLAPVLYELREIDAFAKEYSTDAAAFDATQEFKMLPDLSQILYNEKNLMAREIDFLPNKLGLENKINIFDIGIPNGLNIFPLVFKIFQSGNMGTYVPVTPTNLQAEHAIRKLQLFSMQANLPRMEYDRIIIDPNFNDFQSQVNSITGTDDAINLFIIALPYLGNVSNPEIYLRNIYRSMQEGDRLLVLQCIHNPGSEDNLVIDYQAMSQFMRITQEVSQIINPEYVIKTVWDDSSDNPAIKMTVNVQQNFDFGPVSLTSGEPVTVFRQTFFKRSNMEELFINVGFTIHDMAFDTDMNNTIFFAAK